MKTLIYLDSCYPDYFQGFSGETIIAFCWKGQTIEEVLEDLKHNALNECRDGLVFQAIENFKKENADILNKQFLNEKLIEFDKDGSSDIIHYFGVKVG